MLIKQQQNHLVEQITTAEIIQSLCKKNQLILQKACSIPSA